VANSPPSIRIGQVDLLGGGQQRDLADLLQVHPDRVVGGRLQELVVAGKADAAQLGFALLVAGDLDDLDALLAEMVLDLGQEVLDLLGGEVLHREAFEQLLGGDEAALASPGGDQLFRLVDAERGCGTRPADDDLVLGPERILRLDRQWMGEVAALRHAAATYMRRRHGLPWNGTEQSPR